MMSRWDKRLGDLEARIPDRQPEEALLEELAHAYPVERESGPYGPITAVTVGGVRYEVDGVVTPDLAAACLREMGRE